MSSIPPPPPPPPNLLPTPKVLAFSQRPAADCHNVERVRSAQPTKRPTFANVDAETLQHAAARLRPTQHNKSLLSRGEESLLGRSSVISSGGYRPSESQHDPMAINQTRTTVHASSVGSNQFSPLGVGHEYSVPINQAPQRTTYSSTSTHYVDSPVPPPPSQAPPPVPQDNQSYFSSSASYVSPQKQQPRDFSYISRLANDFSPSNNSYTVQQSSYQMPSNGTGIRTYKTYTSSKTTQLGDSVLPSTIQTGRNLTANPKDYIHDFATQIPIAVLSPSQTTPVTASASNYSYTSTHRTTTPKSLSYAEELRNSALTERQKQSNQYQTSRFPERQVPNSFHSLYEETTRNTTTPQVDDLARDMETRMKTGARDVCSKCENPIVGDTPGVTALGKPFHVNCFSCDVCQKQLAGCSFYNVDGKNLCQVDYMNSLEKCANCQTPITQKILRALSKPYHPECFTCPGCQKSLDGIPFTVSKENVAYCLDCYHERFSPRCAACLKPISPSGNETEVARVVALDKSWHVQCYVCEDCGLQLNSKIEGHACYPLESHLFCKNCNLKRLKAIS